AKLKDAHQKQDIEAIDAASNELNSVWQAASEEMYKAQAQQGQPNGEQQASGDAKQKADSNEEVTDVDFEEVK
ncbi:MAG: molecular chaperone DnaK, partial [Bacteroidales bacterium]|nr:molecular chaperone DnaK [Bacteroidales bacterium]